MYPLKNTVATINLDMVGYVDKQHKNNPNYVYVIGAGRTNPRLKQVNEQINKKNGEFEFRLFF